MANDVEHFQKYSLTICASSWELSFPLFGLFTDRKFWVFLFFFCSVFIVLYILLALTPFLSLTGKEFLLFLRLFIQSVDSNPCYAQNFFNSYNHIYQY